MASSRLPWAGTPTTINLGGSTYRFGSSEEAWRHFNPSAAARWDAQNSPASPAYQAANSGGGGGAGTPSFSVGFGNGGSYTGYGGGSLSAAQIREIADPFYSQRSQYQTQLSNLMANPSSFLSSPLVQAMNANGIEAINRTAAAKKQLNSGNRLADLMKFGQGNAASQYFNQAQLLGGLSGAAPGSPASAASNTVSLASLANNQGQQNQAQQQQDQLRRALENQQWEQSYRNLYSGMSMF